MLCIFLVVNGAGCMFFVLLLIAVIPSVPLSFKFFFSYPDFLLSDLC